jgi:hypothetical protein
MTGRMSKTILRQAWRDVRWGFLSYLVVPPVLEILGSGLGAATFPLICLIVSCHLAGRLGGEEALAGTRDLLRTRALDLRLHVTLRFVLGLGLLGAFVLWCAFIHVLSLDRLFWRIFELRAREELYPLPGGALLQGVAALILAYSLGFAAARGCKGAAAVWPAVSAAAAAVVGGMAILWIWKLYVGGRATQDEVFRDPAFVGIVAAAMSIAAAACFARMRRKARVRP